MRIPRLSGTTRLTFLISFRLTGGWESHLRGQSSADTYVGAEVCPSPFFPPDEPLSASPLGARLSPSLLPPNLSLTLSTSSRLPK